MNKKVEDWVNWVLYDELTAGKINAPKHLLGNHDYGEGQVITVYRPHAEKVVVTSATGKRAKELDRITDAGLFGAYFPKKQYDGTKYRVETTYEDGSVVKCADAYAFPSMISDFDIYLLQRASITIYMRSWERIL